jgi:hypothetical protein
VLMTASWASVKPLGSERRNVRLSDFDSEQFICYGTTLSRRFDLPGNGRSHCSRLDLSPTRAFRHAQKDRAAFQINGPCSAFKAEDRLRTETGDSHILKSQLSPGFHAGSHCRVLVDTVAD